MIFKTLASQKKRRKPKRGATKKKSAGLTRVWVGMLVGMAAGIGLTAYLLTADLSFLDKLKPTPQETVESSKKSTNQEKSADESESSQSFSYHELLTEHTVPVKPKAKTKKSDKRYIMQCGAFKVFADADRLKAKIAFVGLKALIKPSDYKNKTWYRVTLGPYSKKRDAERDRHKLQRADINGCQIW